MMSRRRWLAGWGLLAGTYLTLALIHLLGGGELDSAVVYLVAAAVTFGFAAAVLPIVLPRAGRGDGDPPGGGGPGGPPGPDAGDPPPWWPEFERQFWGYLRERPAREAATAPEPAGAAPSRRS